MALRGVTVRQAKPDRRKEYEDRLKRLGLVKITVWASPEAAEQIKRLAAQSRALPDDG